MSDIDLRTSQFPQDTKERAALAERIADKVRALRLERDSTPDGPGRKSQLKAIGLKIGVLRWKMHLLEPRRYKPVEF